MSAPEQIDEEVLAEAAVGLGLLRLLRHRCRRPLHRDGVASAMENERRPVEVIEGRDLADENDVVASLVIERGAALESSAAPGDQRDAVLAALKREPGKLVGVERSKGQREVALRSGDH